MEAPELCRLPNPPRSGLSSAASLSLLEELLPELERERVDMDGGAGGGGRWCLCCCIASALRADEGRERAMHVGATNNWPGGDLLPPVAAPSGVSWPHSPNRCDQNESSHRFHIRSCGCVDVSPEVLALWGQKRSLEVVIAARKCNMRTKMLFQSDLPSAAEASRSSSAGSDGSRHANTRCCGRVVAR